MKREYTLYPESNLLVEKYTKVLNKEHLDQLDGVLYSKLDKTQEILHLVDLSDAVLFNIGYEEVNLIFQDFIIRLGDQVKTKVALFCGDNDKDDFLKVSTFSKNETDFIQMNCFVDLAKALNWLQLTKTLSHKIWDSLQK